jgi:hypothetical protein
MTMQHAKLADAQSLSNSAGSVYANPASTTTYIRGFTLHNKNTSTETVTLYNVPDSSGSLGTAGTGNQFLEYSMAAKETIHFSFDYPFVLTDTNDAIFGNSTNASQVNIWIHGDKE